MTLFDRVSRCSHSKQCGRTVLFFLHPPGQNQCVGIWAEDSPHCDPLAHRLAIYLSASARPAAWQRRGDKGKRCCEGGVSEPDREGGQQQRFLPLRKDASRPREDALSLRSAAGDNVSDWVWDLRTHRSLACPEIKVVRAGRSSLLSVLQTDAIKCWADWWAVASGVWTGNATAPWGCWTTPSTPARSRSVIAVVCLSCCGGHERGSGEFLCHVDQHQPSLQTLLFLPLAADSWLEVCEWQRKIHLSAATAAVLAQTIDVLLWIKSVVVSVVIFSLPQSPFRCLLSLVISRS